MVRSVQYMSLVHSSPCNPGHWLGSQHARFHESTTCRRTMDLSPREIADPGAKLPRETRTYRSLLLPSWIHHMRFSDCESAISALQLPPC